MKHVLRIVEVVIVGAAVAVLGVKSTKSDAYEEYLKRGGERSFWSWVATGEETLKEELEAAKVQRHAALLEKKALAAKRAAAKAEAERIAKLEAQAEAVRKAKLDESAAAKKLAAAQRKKHAEAAKHRGGSVKTGGKSSYVAGDGRTPYRVQGIQGIEFGTSDNAPGPKIKPLLSVSYDENGNMNFEQLKWRENKKLTDPVYGFDKAWLDHSIDSEQLSSVTFNKQFPFTEQGLMQAIGFYQKMSAQAGDDLGFEPITMDRTANLKSSSILGFTNKGGDTTISGGINAWHDDHFTVTLTVRDKAYSAETKAQSNAAYESGLADSVDARIEVWGKDYTENKMRVNEFLGQ